MRKWTLLWKNWPKSSAWAFKFLLFVCGIGIAQFSSAQFVQKHSIEATTNQVALKSDVKITAVAIIDKTTSASSRTILIGNTKYQLELDTHAPQPTYFVSLPEPASALTLPKVPGKIDVYTIHSGTPPIILSKSDANCTEVNAIPQSDWRAGLPTPNASPSFHTVTHHIVHHSAGSNSNANYVQVVRDIYLLHTEVNGWDDIGYNFVISQDGTLFEGRDPGPNGSEFEVRGAHFCGKNTGTFGVALLGNYQTAQLTSESRETLVNLLTFSLSELEIQPLSSSNHRGVDLDAISGHRDGCATLCPGSNLYPLLPEIRNEVSESLVSCVGILELSFLATQMVSVDEEVAFENTSVGYESYSWKFQGGSPVITSLETPVVTYQKSGLYDVTLYGHAGNQTDSLVATEYIQVEDQNQELVVSPNPVSMGASLNVEFSEDLIQINLFELSGKHVGQYQPSELTSLPAPDRKGIYLIVIETSIETFTQKLIVR